MGYALALGPCICCNRLFSFNPMRVPSSSAITGSREPICSDCVSDLNTRRVANGLDPITPHPDAYDACHESELHDD